MNEPNEENTEKLLRHYHNSRYKRKTEEKTKENTPSFLILEVICK